MSSFGQEYDREQAVLADAMLGREVTNGVLAGRGDPVRPQSKQQGIRVGTGHARQCRHRGIDQGRLDGSVQLRPRYASPGK